MQEMVTHSDIVRRANSDAEFAEMRRVSIHTVRAWKQRNSIPAEYWAGIVADGIASFSELANAAARTIHATQREAKDRQV